MTPYYQDGAVRIYHADVTAGIPLPDASVHCVVTSPPYWGLRDYKTPGQLGLEATPEEYVARMVGVFREVRRVLRDDGTLWLNCGDSYANPSGGYSPTAPSNLSGSKQSTNAGAVILGRKSTMGPGLKPKDLVGIPWRLAFALQADGWYLRSDIIWAKPNPMPESVTDRPTKAHEYVFLLSKKATYYYDAEAVKEPAEYGRATGPSGFRSANYTNNRSIGNMPSTNGGTTVPGSGGSRNLRTVWTIAEEDVEWTLRIGSCRRCGGVRVVGNGSAPTISKAMDVSPQNIGSDPLNSAPIASPMSFLWDQSAPDSPSITCAETRGALTRPTSSPCPSEKTYSEETPRPQEISPRLGVPKDMSTQTGILIDALAATGNAVCACETGRVASELRDVWPLATESFSGAHFATFPRALVVPCVKAGTSEHGCCPQCGAPWARVVERGELVFGGTNYRPTPTTRGTAHISPLNRPGNQPTPNGYYPTTTTGWRLTCACGRPDRVPCTVLDPFAGAGTALFVAKELGRRAVGIELKREYIDLAARRLLQEVLPL